MYDFVTESWSTEDALPCALCGARAFATGGKIYVPGGYLGAMVASDALLIYDPETHAWSAGESMPLASELYAGGVIGNEIYVAGGRNLSVQDSAWVNVQAYSVTGGTWRACTDMPTPRRAAASAVVDGKLYVISGGEGNAANWGEYDIYDAVEIFDPTSEPTEPEPPCPRRRLVHRSGRRAGVDPHPVGQDQRGSRRFVRSDLRHRHDRGGSKR